jgi:LacI family transcriptional regulator
MILFATEMEEADFRIFQNISIPMVVLDCYYDTLDYDCVLINNIQGAFKATDYLIRCGHKHVGYLHSSIDISNFRERADGYYKALRTHGLDTSHPFVHRISPTSQEGYQDMIRILEEKPALADAYFADNDIIAAAAMRAFQQFGYRIPEDISIIGFDDLPLCDLMHPPLSTMRVDQQELGMLAAGRLYEIMEKNDLQKLKISITASMVCRESVQK